MVTLVSSKVNEVSNDLLSFDIKSRQHGRARFYQCVIVLCIIGFSCSVAVFFPLVIVFVVRGQ